MADEKTVIAALRLAIAASANESTTCELVDALLDKAPDTDPRSTLATNLLIDTIREIDATISVSS